MLSAEMKKPQRSKSGEALQLDLAVQPKEKDGKECSMPKKNFAEFLEESPLAGAELDLERDRDPGKLLSI